MNSNHDRPNQTDSNVVPLVSVREASHAADRLARSMPPPDTQRMIRAAAGPPAAAKPRGTLRTWALRGAVAAALVAATAGVLLTVGPAGNADDPLPDHLSAFVDSLYSRDDDVLDSVWQSVAAEVETR